MFLYINFVNVCLMCVCGSKIHTCAFVNQIAQIETVHKGFSANKRRFVWIAGYEYAVCSTMIYCSESQVKDSVLLTTILVISILNNTRKNANFDCSEVIIVRSEQLLCRFKRCLG